MTACTSARGRRGVVGLEADQEEESVLLRVGEGGAGLVDLDLSRLTPFMSSAILTS